MTTPALPPCLVDERLVVTMPEVDLVAAHEDVDSFDNDYDREQAEKRNTEQSKMASANHARLIVVLEVLVQEGFICFSLHQGNIEILDELRQLFETRAEFGVHGVRDLASLERVLSKQPQFVLTDNADARLIETGNGAGISTLPAALTPNEVGQVAALGAAAVQVFPADLLGGNYPEALRRIVGDVALIARGGLGGWSTGRWLDASAVACCLDETMIGDALSPSGNLAQLRERAQSYLKVAKEERS